MLELSILTTDQNFASDLNSAGIDGITAKNKQTLAFDSAEHLLQIVIHGLTDAGLALAAAWMVDRYKKERPKRLDINNQTINSADSIITVVNIYIDSKDKT